MAYKILSFLILFLFSYQCNAQKFYKTPSGHKFHLATCRMVKNVSEEVSPSQIADLGLEPCKICHPQILTMAALTQTKVPQGQSRTVQCRGITKSGSRCRHMTSIANGFCFQHQPE